MRKFNKVIDEAIAELVQMARDSEEVKEYLSEEYGSIAEDDTELCVIEYIAQYYNVINDIVDRYK